MTPPFTIAHYRITAKLGEGGMGAVYQATDTKLNREVAIKVLPDALAGDADYLARFTREAQVLASLNHPNIAILHGVEDRALVMELVPGQTLDEIVAAGHMAVKEALEIAGQIAEALEAAHEKGVIHRDLKPANVKVTPEGTVKVLDFGLAKAAEPASAAAAANSPTLTIRATHAGIILGTAGYMAPEQAAGKPVDRRADIWAFGVVLWELLTGKTLFTGETVSHTLASVLKDPIDLAIPQAPAAVRRLLTRCLTRDPKSRLRDIGEARVAIREYLANPAAEAEPAGPAPAAAVRSARLPWILCGGLLLGLSGTLAWNYFQPAAALPVMRFHVSLGEDRRYTSTGRALLAISPDGSQVVYVANRRLYLRSMAESEARAIAMNDSRILAAGPVFSPDGESLAFFDGASQSIKRVAASGGAPVTVCEAAGATGMSWSENGIVFSVPEEGVFRASPDGGQPEKLIPVKENEQILSPELLPGGEAVLLSIGADRLTGNSSRLDRAQVMVQTLKSGARKLLVDGGSNARYLPTGHLVYLQYGVLFAVPFDLRRLEVTGGKVGIVEGVSRPTLTAQYSISRNGTLVYVAGPVTSAGPSNRQLALVELTGGVKPLSVPPGPYSFPRASRDGKRIAYQSDDGREVSIWILELDGGAAARRLTLAGSGSNRYPIWSPDGERVAFQSDRGGDLGIWWQRSDGSGTAERLTTPEKGASHMPDSWSPDGQTISFTEEKGNAGEVWTYSLKGRKAELFAATPGAPAGRSAFSPDGRWVAYQSMARAAGSRVYIRPFPPTATAYMAPEDGDTHHPVWSPDGKTLFYVPGPSQYGSMSVSTQPNVRFGTPVRAAQSGFMTAIGSTVRTYDILPDGKRFIGVVQEGLIQSGTNGFEVVLNWFEELKQRTRRN